MEDYFQGKAFAGLIDRRQWAHFETRVERNTLATLELLHRHDATATFFIMSWIAEHHPELVREIVRRGHHVACGGDSQRSFRNISPTDFSREIQRSRDLLERASGVQARGYRVADHLLSSRDLWALEVLARHGYEYDSSINPSFFSFHGEPWRRFVHQQRFADRALWEIPLSSFKRFGVQVPVAGGNWFRQLPETFVRSAMRGWDATCPAPFVMYFRVWDLDAGQPVITSASQISRFRHYRNPRKISNLIESFLAEYRFSSIESYLGLQLETVSAQSPACEPLRAPAHASIPKGRRTPVTIVIPCYNEESALPYLANSLRQLSSTLDRYDLHFLFVDDGSRDDTVNLLHRLFDSWPGCEIIQHAANRGVAAAILTGIHRASTEIVCSMDCDCTYDPQELARMIPMLAPGIDLVTASPYHPQGHVARVPQWRLALSKTASLLYRCVLRQKLYTYTSCFRVYRRSAVLPIQVQENGFLGVAETLARLDFNGSRILEYPATLNVRMLGHSKMRVMKTIAGHIRLMARFAIERLSGRGGQKHPDSPDFASTLYASKGVNRE